VSLVGFKAQNHQQQLDVRGPRSHVDDRALPPKDFAALNERFRFSIDVAASVENAKLPRFITAEQDALKQSWAGERVYCNPPYSSIEPWCEKAHSEWRSVGPSPTGAVRIPPAELIVMLLPANRTEQGWWQRQIEPQRRDGRIRVEFLPGRLRFLKPGQKRIGANERPPFGCCLVIWGES
jgi:phage N-6-adenine-methyltransferase